MILRIVAWFSGSRIGRPLMAIGAALFALWAAKRAGRKAGRKAGHQQARTKAVEAAEKRRADRVEIDRHIADDNAAHELREHWSRD